MLLEELKTMVPKKIKLFVDNKLEINLENQPVCHNQSKHIERRYHFLRDQVNKGKVEIKHCKTEVQLADIFTKPQKKVRFEKLKRNIEMRSLENMN